MGEEDLETIIILVVQEEEGYPTKARYSQFPSAP